jgi:hypothetical protein
MRDDFTEEVKRAIAQRVNYMCSRCNATTTGPQAEASKALNVGVAAHITAASREGPRYDESLTSEQRRHANNGVWLCQTCAKLVDNDAARFTVETVRGWKDEAERRAFVSIGKTATSHPAPSLRIELPTPVNRVGHRSGGHFTSGWRVKVRLIAEGQPLNIVELGVNEGEVGPWAVNEVFWDNGRGVLFPIVVERSTDFWIDASSPQSFETKPTSVGPIMLRFRDHTQKEGEWHELRIDHPAMQQ